MGFISKPIQLFLFISFFGGASASGAVPPMPLAGKFSVSPFGGGIPIRSELEAGIQELFRNSSNCVGKPAPCPTAQELKQLTDRSLAYHRNLVQISQKTQQLEYREEISEGFAYTKKEFAFRSLVQTGRNENNDWVYGTYVVPRRFSACPHRFPTAVIIQSSVGDFENDEFAMMNGLVKITQSMGALVIRLPYYGERHPNPAQRAQELDADNGQSYPHNLHFIATDEPPLKKNFAQAMLDIHASLDWLDLQSSSDPNQVTMLGMSMGGFLQTLFEGLNPGRVKGGHIPFLGAADWASLLQHHIHEYPQDPLSTGLLKNGFTENHGRSEIAEVDPLTWSGRIHGQTFQFIQATEDELIDRQNNLLKLTSFLSKRNSVQLNWVESKHAPREIGVFAQMTEIFWPIQSFVLRNAGPVPPMSCK